MPPEEDFDWDTYSYDAPAWYRKELVKIFNMSKKSSALSNADADTAPYRKVALDLLNRYSTEKHSESFEIDVRRIATAIVSSKEFEEIFEGLSIERQLAIVNVAKYFSPENFASYLMLLEIAGNPNPVVLNEGMQNVAALKSSLRKASNIPFIDELGLYKLYQDFMLYSHVKNDSTSKAGSFRDRNDFDAVGNMTILCMAKMVFGSKTLMEISEKSNVEEVAITLSDVVRLASNWMELKSYPLAWAVQVSARPSTSIALIRNVNN